MFHTDKRAVNCGLGCGGQGGGQTPVGAGLGAFWQASPSGSPAERRLRPGPSRTHPEPALALGAVVHLDLPQGNGVDDPVDQLLADLLCGALQRQRPAAGRGCQGLPGCAAVGRGTPPCHLLSPDEAKGGGWPQGPPVQNGTGSQLEGWGLPPAPASSPRQPRRLWTRRTH